MRYCLMDRPFSLRDLQSKGVKVARFRTVLVPSVLRAELPDDVSCASAAPVYGLFHFLEPALVMTPPPTVQD